MMRVDFLMTLVGLVGLEVWTVAEFSSTEFNVDILLFYSGEFKENGGLELSSLSERKD